MKIEHLSFSSSGGAGSVAETLAREQSLLGNDVTFSHLIEGDLRKEPWKNPLITAAAVLDRYLITNRDSTAMFSFARRKIPLWEPSKPNPDSILHLHWLEGVMNHRGISQLLSQGQKIVWTHHDMAPITGGCHHSLGCTGYVNKCSDCPMVRIPFKKSVSASLLENVSAFPPGQGIRIVAPSRWLAKKINESQIFRNYDVEVIENPIADAFFRPRNKAEAREILSVSSADLVGACVATQLDNPQKNIRAVLESYFSVCSQAGLNASFILIGSGGESFTKDFPGVILAGSGDSEHVASHLIAADFVASASIAESSGLTIREAGALGIPALVISNGGSDELVVNGVSGRLFSQLSEFEKGLREVCSDLQQLRSMGVEAAKLAITHSTSSISAGKYLRLYERL